MRKIAVLLTLVMVLASFASCNLVSSPSGGSGTSHTVTYDAGEGSSVGQVTVAKLTEEAATTREGYIFCGWYLDSELKNAVSYPMNVTADITLYAKWIPESAGMTCDDASVKFAVDDDYGYKAEYVITPEAFDIKALADRGYSILVEVSYEVYYEKDYGVAFDIGYLGAPDHDVSIVDDLDEGVKNTDLPTEKEPKAETITATVKASSLLKSALRLKLMTYNLQNVVYYRNITVSFAVVATE